jgi:hypothetical protein
MDRQPDDSYSDEEAARRRDALVRRMIATPPKPQKQTAQKRPAKRARRRGQKS